MDDHAAIVSREPEVLRSLVATWRDDVAYDRPAPDNWSYMDSRDRSGGPRADLPVHIRRSVAGNPACPSDLLEILADDPDSCVQANALGNLNFPASGFRHLAVDRRLPLSGIHNPNCPTDVLALLAELGAADRSVARSERCPPEALIVIAERGQADREIAQNSKTPVAVFSLLAKRGGVDAQIVDNCRAPPATVLLIANRLLTSTDAAEADDVLSRIAKRQDCPSRLYEQLAKRRGVAAAVAGNPTVSADLLAEMAMPLWSATHFSKDRRHLRDLAQALAANPNTPAYVLELLALVDFEWLCRAVGRSFGVQYSLATNPSTPPTILAMLARYQGLESAIAGNPNAGVLALYGTLVRLRHRDDLDGAKHRWKLPGHLRKHVEDSVGVHPMQTFKLPWEVGRSGLQFIVAAIGAGVVAAHWRQVEAVADWFGGPVWFLVAVTATGTALSAVGSWRKWNL